MARAATKAQVFDLGAIGTALDDRDAPAALTAALVAWRQTRAESLANLVDVIGSRLAGDAIETDADWSATARVCDPADLGRLLDAIPSLAASFLPSAGEALAKFEVDPRIAKTVATWALDPPTTSSSTYPFWTKSFDAMTRAGDPRTVPILKKRLKKTKGDSQFWPKFYKAIEKAIEKIAKQPVVPVDEKLVAKFSKQATKLEVAVADRAPAPTTPKLEGPPLGQALAHVAAGRLTAAIDALIAAWPLHERAPRIADTIDRATMLLPSWDRALGTSDKAAVAAWDAAWASDPQAAMPQLLENFLVGGPKEAEKRLVEFASLPEDPRIGYRLADLCMGRTVSPERTQYWKATFDLIARIRDPRTTRALCTAFHNFEGNYYNHHRQARRMISEWAMNPPIPPMLGPTETAALDKIDTELAKLEAKRDTTERTLIDAIVDAWDDNGPRLVYADWLTDRQSPRGEVIVLSCKPVPTAAESKRLKETLRKTSNIYGVVDEVSRIWNPDRHLGLVRGMPTSFTLDHGTSLLFWRRLAGYPLLATIEKIVVDYNPTMPDPADFARVLLDPTARRLRIVENVPQDYCNKLRAVVADKWRFDDNNSLVRA